jgi:hypothetical protein
LLDSGPGLLAGRSDHLLGLLARSIDLFFCCRSRRPNRPYRRHNGAEARRERKNASDEGLPVIEPIPKGRVMPRRLGDLDRDHALPRRLPAEPIPEQRAARFGLGGRDRARGCDRRGQAEPISQRKSFAQILHGFTQQLVFSL